MPAANKDDQTALKDAANQTNQPTEEEKAKAAQEEADAVERARLAADKLKEKIGQPKADPLSPDAVARPDEDLVEVFVPKEFRLLTDNHEQVLVGAGQRLLPASIADHWWAKANGVTRKPAAQVSKAKN
jgi:hypothetical protein